MSKNKSKAIEGLLKAIDLLDKTGINRKKYEELFERQTEAEFLEWVEKIRKGELKISMEIPNSKKEAYLTRKEIRKVGEKLGTKVFEKVTFTDKEGDKFTPNHIYNLLLLPVARMDQHISSYIRVGKSNKQRNPLTDQVTGDSKAGSMTLPETYIFSALKLDNTLDETMSIRGGDRLAMLAMENHLEQHGEVSLEDVKRVRSKASAVKRLVSYFKALHIELNA